MKDAEQIIRALEICAHNDKTCRECPYEGDKMCHITSKLDAVALIRKLTEPPTTECDYEAIAQIHSEEIRKLNDQLRTSCVAYEGVYQDLVDAQKELTVLRAVKATAEAFLGVKINESTN